MSITRTGCSRCRERDNTNLRRLYVVQGASGESVFDVSKATTLATNGRLPYTIPRDLLDRLLVINNEFSEEHLAHVNAYDPGIVGQHIGGMLLLDGNHEAVLAKRQRLEFFAYMLTFAETQACRITPAHFTSLMIAQEIRGLLRNYPNTHRLMRVDVPLEPRVVMQHFEDAIRAELTPLENDQIQLSFHRKIQVIS